MATPPPGALIWIPMTAPAMSFAYRTFRDGCSDTDHRGNLRCRPLRVMNVLRSNAGPSDLEHNGL